MELRARLDEFKQSRRSVRPAEMRALLLAAGFSRRYGKGDHWVYTHTPLRFPLTIDPRNPLLPSYVSKAIRAIEVALENEDR